MASGGFSIVISANDKASAQIEAINKRIAAMRAPAERMEKALARFASLTGLSKVSEGFKRIARSSLDAFRSLSRIVEPLAAITGAASLAGMFRLTSAWGQFGSRLGFAAQRIGISATQLQSLQGAAELAGSSASGLASGMQNLGQVMYDAVGGRNPQAVQMFRTLGVAFKDASGHARSVTQVLPELADKIAAMKDPYAQAQAATVLFGGSTEDLLPFLRRGAAGIQELTDKAIRYGVMNQQGIEAANQMREANTGLRLSVEGLGNSIAQRLSPVIVPLLNHMADWIAANRKWIAQDIGEYVKQFAVWVRGIDFQGILKGGEQFLRTANSIARALGGWKPVLEGLFALMAAKWAIAFITPFATAGASVFRLTSAMLRLRTVSEEALTAEKAAGSGGGAGGFGKLLGPGLMAWNVYEDWKNGKLGTKLTPELLQQVPGLKSQLTQAQVDQINQQKEQPDWWRDHVNRPVRQFFGLERGSSTSSTALTTRQQQAAQQTAFNTLTKAGWSPVQAAGIVANMTRESGMNAQAVGDNGAAYGIGQWHADRQAQFAKLFGHNIRQSTLAEQIKFYDWELHNTEKKAGDDLRKARMPYASASIVSLEDERPADKFGEARTRGMMAQAFYERLVSSAAITPAAAPAKLGQQPGDSVATVRGSADLNITVNAPPGTKTTATTKGDLFNTPRIASGLSASYATP